jgi:molecular chaperone DnaJ
MKKDYYEILGVSKTASKDEIKKAFHKMAHTHHPDKKGGDEAKFKEVNEAYQTLSDENKRAQYDRFGSGYQQTGAGQGAGFDPNGFGFDFSGFQNGQGFDMNDFGDIFSDFFGGGYGRGGSQPKRGRDISTEISISFEESMFGVERDIVITKTSACDECHGNGAKKGASLKKCTTCNGQGQIRENRQTILGVMATTRVCETCHGVGEIPEEKCLVCKGHGVLKKQSEIKVRVPMGIANGQMIKLVGFGEAVAHGSAGDLYVRINVTPHKTFKRDGNNLVYPLTIKVTQALLGGEHTIETFDGPLVIKIPQGISHGEILRVKDKGVPLSKSKRGDLLIPIKVTIPQKLSRKERELIEALEKEGL